MYLNDKQPNNTSENEHSAIMAVVIIPYSYLSFIDIMFMNVRLRY